MRPCTARHAVFVVALGASLASAPAIAQPVPGRPAPAPAPRAAPRPRNVREIYKRAVLNYQAGKYQQAYDGFKEVWATEKKPKVAGNLGRAALKLGKPCEAAEYLGVYLDQDQDLSKAEIQDIQRQITEAKSQLVLLTVDAPPGAELTLDGQSAGTAPLPRDLCVTPGPHTVEATRGTTKLRKDIQTTPGTPQTVKLEIAAPPPPPPPPPTAKPETRSMAPAVVMGGVGAAALIAGGVSLGMYLSKREEARGIAHCVAEHTAGCETTEACMPESCTGEDARQIANEADVFRQATPYLLTGGAVLVTAAIVYKLWPAPAPSKGDSGQAARSRWNVMVTPQGGAVTLSGQF